MENLRILAILPISIGGRLTTNSIIDGFRQNNCQVVVYDELFDKNLSKILNNETFDYIVGYDFSGLKIKIDNNLKIPSINYFSDEIRNKTSGPEWEIYLQYLNNDDNYTFYWDKELVEQEKFKNIFYLPHFVNLDIYYDTKTEPKFDIMFAGRLDTDIRLDYFEKIITTFKDKKIGWFAIERHFQDAKKRSKYPNLIEKCYQGFIDNEYDMAKRINESKLVYNINAQGLSSLNYRTIQTLACKKLIISDYRKELDSLFNSEIPYYNSIEDLLYKIDYYLKNQEEYNTIVNSCYEKIKQNHNSKDCVKKIINTVKE